MGICSRSGIRAAGTTASVNSAQHTHTQSTHTNMLVRILNLLLAGRTIRVPSSPPPLPHHLSSPSPSVPFLRLQMLHVRACAQMRIGERADVRCKILEGFASCPLRCCTSGDTIGGLRVYMRIDGYARTPGREGMGQRLERRKKGLPAYLATDGRDEMSLLRSKRCNSSVCVAFDVGDKA